MIPSSALAALAGRAVHHLSPHPDDAAFSSAATLAALARRGSPIRLHVAFTRSAYTAAGAETDPARITRLRRAEDEAFARSLPGDVRLDHLGFADAPLRPGHDLGSICDGAPLAAADRALAADLAGALGAALPRGGALLAPLGIGRHVDHRIAAAAALAAARAGGLELLLYEDLPYAGHLELAAVDAHVAAFARDAGVTLAPLVHAAADLPAIKRAALACYPSQLTAADLAAALAHAARLGGAERLHRATATTT